MKIVKFPSFLKGFATPLPEIVDKTITMKHITLIALTLLILTAALQAKAQQFTLSGKITGEPDAYVFLKYINDKGEAVKDSCSLKTGEFSFKGTVGGPTMAYFAGFVGRYRIRDDSDPNSTSIFVEPGNITATGTYGHFKELKVTGSKINDEFVELSKQPASVFVANANSVVSAFYLNIYKTRLQLDSVESLYNKMATPVRESIYGKEIFEHIVKMSKVSTGKSAVNFSAVDINGKRISLADFKGKYVLLDFWGSWCGPCRESTPHLKQLFAKYNKMGLDVLAIAVDDKPKNWKAAIKKDGTSIWHNVLDIESTDKAQAIHEEFTVHIFPTKILIDKNGIVLARFIGTSDDSALDKKLAEVFE